MNLANVYPYLAPSGYLETMPGGPAGFYLPFGHDTYVILMHDHDGVSSNVMPDELDPARLSPEALHQRALSNLVALAEEQAIQKTIHQNSEGLPFILCSGHWLTASCIRLPNLHAFASRHLKSDSLCVSVPQREAMLIFPFGTREQRDQMRTLIRENETNARKPITWGLFELSNKGATPWVEADELSPEKRKLAARLGFTDLHSFKDYVVFVLSCAQENWLPPEDQLDFERSFAGLEIGYLIAEEEIGRNPVFDECRRLTAEALAFYRSGRDHDGQRKMEQVDSLISQLPSR